MKENYGEQLAKTMRLKTAILSTRRSAAWRAAQSSGLLDLLASASLRRFVEALTGLRLGDECGAQVICYESGDYSGPHSPEDKHLRNGSVDVHLMFSNSGVKSQWLVYEEQGYLTDTTPLVPRRGARAARRGLLLASFELPT